MTTSQNFTIEDAIHAYLESVKMARSANTARTYTNGLNAFCASLSKYHMAPHTTLTSELTEEAIVWFATALKRYAPTTESLYITAASGFFEYLAAERLAEVNLPRLRLLIRQRTRRTGQRLPQFPRNDIENIINYASNIAESIRRR